jgi:flagellar M-ring protein FliF
VNGLLGALVKAGPVRLMAALGVVALVAAALFAITFRMGGEENGLLYADLDPSEAAQITERLGQANITYEVRGDGTSIFVPRSRVGEARMMLSADGLPSRGSVGYELFDSQDALGATQFQQNINRLRALEGELARTIGSLTGVEQARVHLVLPERQLFERTRQDPSASIVIKLLRDDLTSGQVRAIRNLVASAVPGLSAQRVTILDENGTLLASGSGDPNEAAGAELDERQAAAEARLRATVTDIVESVVGAGNARVQVSAELDFSRVQETSETFDPEGRVVRSMTSVSDTSTDSEPSPTGEASASSNVPDGTGGDSATSQASASERLEETTNYEISRTVRNQTIEGGRIRRLSVAVAVDGISTPAAEPGGAPTWAPRPPEDVERITALVRSAVGFNEQRGDRVEVQTMQFQRPEALTSAGSSDAPAFATNDIMRFAEVGAALLAALALIFFVLRPLIAGLVRGGAAMAGGTAGASPGALTGPQGAQGAMVGASGGGGMALPPPEDFSPRVDVSRIQGQVKASAIKQVAEVVTQHPDESVTIIRGWLNNT